MKLNQNLILQTTSNQKKSIAVLIDPDKFNLSAFNSIDSCNVSKIDFIFVGGSLINHAIADNLVKLLKTKVDVPVILFPGSSNHLMKDIDAILFLSLISGRNAEFLIGQHVLAAPMIKLSAVQVIPTGYMLIDGGSQTTANYMSNTVPIPSNKPEIAVCTAMAGEILGLQLIFMDAGSGAKNEINGEMINAVKKNISIPLIIGGGINTVQKAKNAFENGADVIVIGTLFEDSPSDLNEILEIKNIFNS